MYIKPRKTTIPARTQVIINNTNPNEDIPHSQKKQLSPLCIIISVSLLPISNWVGWLNPGKSWCSYATAPGDFLFTGLDITWVYCINAADLPFTGLECQLTLLWQSKSKVAVDLGCSLFSLISRLLLGVLDHMNHVLFPNINLSPETGTIFHYRVM